MQSCSRLFLLAILVVFSVGILTMPASSQTFTALHNFNCAADGCMEQQTVPLAQGRDGDMYGQSYSGGTDSIGTIFKISPAGVYGVVYDLIGTQTQNSVVGGVTLAPDGNFYGTSHNNGLNQNPFTARHRPFVACYFRALPLGEASRVAPIDDLSVVIAIALAKRYAHIGHKAMRNAMELLGKANAVEESPKSEIAEQAAVN